MIREMRKTEIPEDISALARKVGRQFKSDQDLALHANGMSTRDNRGHLPGEVRC
jgi:hypothetical protein